MSFYETKFKSWQSFSDLEPLLQKDLEKISGDKLLLEDCFHKHLEFGTGGMRAEMGAGTNRMNIYTVRRAAKGLAKTIAKGGDLAKERGVVIAYDSRLHSAEFALEVAKTVGFDGVKAYLFSEPTPTPLLSFAVRHLKASAGVVITASHNPSEYNGFKAYGADGGQLPLLETEAIVSVMEQVEDELNVSVADANDLLSKGLLVYIGEDINRAYITCLLNLQCNKRAVEEFSKRLKIVYTPLHGAGTKAVCAGLSAFGFKEITLVKEQALPDGTFPTTPSPNPEELAAFAKAISVGKRVQSELLLATDPDVDRLGVAIKNDLGTYQLLTGNQIGALLLDYWLSQQKISGKLPKNGVAIKSIVTSELGRKIAESYGCKLIDTLTGFKFIGEKINEFEKSGEHKFLFGYEESNGYLLGDFVREKDAIQAAVMFSEMAAYYKGMGMSVYEVLLDLYKVHGFYQERLYSLTLKGLEGKKRIEDLLLRLRSEKIDKLSERVVIATEDYSTGIRTEKHQEVKINLPKANVLKYLFDDNSWVCVRPSGTEPKIKFYFAVTGALLEESKKNLELLQHQFIEKIEELMK